MNDGRELGLSFSDIDVGVLSHILSKCCVHDFRQLALVSKRWSGCCRDREVVRAASIRTWKLAGIDGDPDPVFLRNLRVTSFSQLHVLRRGDSLLGLALRYGTSEVDLRVRNNLLSERAISSHEALFVPVKGEADLAGKRLRVVVSGAMRRLLPVVYDEAFPDIEKRLRSPADPAAALQLKAKALQQELKVHEGYASYYIGETRGDMVAARALHAEDEEWETSASGRRMLRAYNRRKGRASCGCDALCSSWWALTSCCGLAGCLQPRAGFEPLIDR